MIQWWKTLWKSFAMEDENSRVVAMKKKSLVFLWSLVLLDQISKRIFVQSSYAGFLSFFPPVWNKWAAWSLAVHPYISLVLGFICVVWILWYSRKWNDESQKYIYLLVIAWILWNMIDRIHYAAVRDFLWIGDRFPIFNLADVYMCGGVALVLWIEWRKS